MKQPLHYQQVETCVDAVLQRIGMHIVLAAPAGIGKPNQLLNAFYQRAKSDPHIKLQILTGLSLEKPTPKNDMEKRFLHPFIERVFGDYVELDYMLDLRKNQVPANISISEFYFKAGAMKKVGPAQRRYVASNFTHVARDMAAAGVNVLIQLVAAETVEGRTRYSLSSNTDTTPELKAILEAKRDQGFDYVTIAQTHSELPYMRNHAEVEADFFDMVISSPDYDTRLFAPPNMAVPPRDAIIGLYASSLIRDGGTLQIGIGSLGDAIAYACLLRQQHNHDYCKLLAELPLDRGLLEREGGSDSFSEGLFGASEMLVNGLLQLIKAGIVKRETYDDLALQTGINQGLFSKPVTPAQLHALLQCGAISSPLSAANVDYLKYWGIFNSRTRMQDGKLLADDVELDCNLSQSDTFDAICQHCLGQELQHGIVMQGGFFIGPADFYACLREMPRAQLQKIDMRSIAHINQLSHNYDLLTAQRRHARFINTGMMVTLGGAVVSDGLENGTVISGVGGQYNFVAMAHELPGARSILCIRSTRGYGSATVSNIVPHYGHITIPRHLRDIIITEYGIADLRGQDDETIIKRLLNVTDSRFQQELLDGAREQGKIANDYRIPQQFRNNRPRTVHDFISRWQARGLFPDFPLGTDFSAEEIALGKSLRAIKQQFDNPKQLLKAVIKAMILDVDEDEAAPFLQRIGLQHPDSTRENILQHLILLQLEENGYLKSI